MDGTLQLVTQSVLIAGWTIYVLTLLLRRSPTDNETPLDESQLRG